MPTTRRRLRPPVPRLPTDAETGTVTARIGVPARLAAESSVGAGEHAVWVLTADSPPRLLAIDPRTNTVARTHPASDGAVAVRAGLGSLWVSVATPGQVVRIDPASGAVVAKVAVGKGASFLAIGPDAVWVVGTSDGTVTRVDPKSNTVAATVEVAADVVHGGDIAVATDAVWVRLAEGALAVRIDPRVNAVTDRFGPSAGSGGVALADSSVWISARSAQTIWRLDR